jgi:hypothetical protein
VREVEQRASAGQEHDKIPATYKGAQLPCGATSTREGVTQSATNKLQRERGGDGKDSRRRSYMPRIKQPTICMRYLTAHTILCVYEYRKGGDAYIVLATEQRQRHETICRH